LGFVLFIRIVFINSLLQTGRSPGRGYCIGLLRQAQRSTMRLSPCFFPGITNADEWTKKTILNNNQEADKIFILQFRHL
jgi:hypothetical protein